MFIPVIIIEDILSRVPAKSLLRFKCVSKPWLEKISHSNFIQLHYKRSEENNRLKIILSNGNQQVYSSDIEAVTGVDNGQKHLVNLNYSRLKGSFQIIGICNGLLCMCVLQQSQFSILNPSTRQHREYRWYPSGYACLFAAKGFGYDPINNDYKIVYVHPDNIFIYSVDTSSWNKIVHHGGRLYMRYTSIGVFLRGVLHWRVNSQVIFCFNCTNEQYYQVSLPQEEVDFMELSVFRGQICATYQTESDVIMWVMRDNGVWTKLVTINDPIIKKLYFDKRYIDFCMRLEDGNEILYMSAADDKRLQGDGFHNVRIEGMCIDGLICVPR